MRLRLKDFLKKNKIDVKKIADVDFHMRFLSWDLDEFKYMFELNNRTNEEIIKFIQVIYDKCDQKSPNYDSKFDEEMTTIGLRLNDHFEYPKRNNKNIFGDYHGWGRDITADYDNNIDFMNDKSK